MQFVEIVALLAVAQFLFFGVMVGKARGASGLKAPAMTGDAGFERMSRVHLNTAEMLIAFFPTLYVAAQHGAPLLVAAVGAVFLVGRHIYWRSYVKDPSTRTLGFALTIGPVFVLMLMGLVGAVL